MIYCDFYICHFWLFG